MIWIRPCIFCWTPSPHSRPDEFHQLQERVRCPRCGDYRLSGEAYQDIYDAYDESLNAHCAASPIRDGDAISRFIRARFEAAGHQEVVIEDWESFSREAREAEK